MPKVSVIVPNYNHSKFLSQRLKSIFNQTYQDFEVILLDDFSTDNSLEILDQYRNHPKVSIIDYNDLNSGSTFKQWEKGISLSTGDYIWIAESDDYCESTFLSELVPLLDKYSHVGIAYCQSISVDSNSFALYNWLDHTANFLPNIWQNSFLVAGTIAIQNFFVNRNVIPNASGVLFRKSIYNKTSGIDTAMTLNGDWFLWIKLLEISSLLFVAKNLNYFRQHNEKATGRNTKNYNNLKEIFELFKYIENRMGLPSVTKKQMTNMMAHMWIAQIKNTSLSDGFKYFSKVNKSAFSFNRRFYLNFGYTILKLTKNSITRLKNTSEIGSISISTIPVDFL